MTAVDTAPDVAPEDLHHVHVRLAQYDRSTFLALVAAVHRRAVDVVGAELRTVQGEPPAFTVSFRAPRDRADTLTATLRNLVDVLDADRSGAAT